VRLSAPRGRVLWLWVVGLTTDRILKIKTQSFGRAAHCIGGCVWPQMIYLARARLSPLSLKDYREQRENGDKRDEPKEAFPAAGFDGLDIESSEALDWSNKWPDKEGRYWWKLKCKDGREINDYYWMQDKVRGYRDNADSNRCWFSFHHAPSGTKIEGFSQRLGYPDKDGNYWSYIQYDECGPIKAWMEQKDKNYVARLQREKEQEQSNAAALRAAEEKQRQEQLVAERLRIAEMKELEDRKIREESEKRAAQLQRLEEARLAAENAQRLAAALRAAEEKQRQAQLAERLRIAEMKELEDRKIREDREKDAAQIQRLGEAKLAAENAQRLVAAEKKALEEERLRAEQEKRQLEEQRRKFEEEQAKKLSAPVASSSSSPSSRPGFPIDSSFSIRYEDIQVIRVLGEGAFGVVSYGKWHYEDVAVKTLHLQRLSENALLEFKEEAAIMARLRSDYIVLLKGVSLQPYALVMEYMPGGSLFNLLHSQKELPMAIRHRIALDVAKGLAFLHQHPPQGILHRDLKSQNVLLTEYLHAKLADFGLSKVRVESSRSQAYAQSSNKSVGTIPWMAPECFGIRPKYSEKSDMYAYGMVLWELISRRMPYEDVTDANEIREAVKSGEREDIPEQTTNPREEVPVSFKDVIRFCWFQEVDKRPAAKDAIEALGNIAISMPNHDVNHAFRQLKFYIPYEDITLGRLLGRGGFGEVFEGDRHGEKVAVKRLHSHIMSEKEVNEFKQEVAIMASLHFDYIVTFKGMCVEPYCLVMEYMPGGSLFGVLHSPAMLPWHIRHGIALDVAKGLAFLHMQTPLIIHRDLKSENILLTENYLCAKLTDFGISRTQENSATVTTGNFFGTLSWLAPECLAYNNYSIRSDMYAYGMVLWELVSRKKPYPGLKGHPLIAINKKVVRDDEREDIPDEMNQLSDDRPTAKTPQSITKFIRLCWFKESERRPTAQEAVKAFEQDIERQLVTEYAGQESLDSSSSSSSSSRFNK
jgi:serine/threonine protein kinase